MSASIIELRFCACPVDRPKFTGEIVESIASGTTTWPAALPVLFGSHDGKVLGHTGDVFEDSDPDGIRGIGGRLRLVVSATEMWRVTSIVRESWGASIEFCEGTYERRVIDGIETATLVGARLTHVALVPVERAAFGDMTSVWRAGRGSGIEGAPLRIRAFDERWERGFRVARAEARAARRAEARRRADDERAIASWSGFSAFARWPRDIQLALARDVRMPPVRRGIAR
jgi:hypothetical protein